MMSSSATRSSSSVGRNSSSVKVRPAVSRNAAPPSAMPKRTWSATLSRSSQMRRRGAGRTALARSMIGSSDRLGPWMRKTCTASRWASSMSTTRSTRMRRRSDRRPPEVVVEHLLELRDGGLDRRLEERLLRGEVVEHARLRVAGVVGDVLQRGGREADRRELLEGGLLQFVGGAHARGGRGVGGHAIERT